MPDQNSLKPQQRDSDSSQSGQDGCARVIANFGATVAVRRHGQTEIIQATPLRSLPLLVSGDLVVIDADDETNVRVTELLPRSSVLQRADRRQLKPLAANLTHLGIVSAAPPGIDTLLIDQLCLAANRAGVSAIILFNKADLLTGEALDEARRWLAVYQSIGYPAVMIDTKTPGGMQPLLDELPGRILTLVGASGVGKSSIVQQLLPDLEVRIGAISRATGMGSHTTSVTCWYDLPDNAGIIDSPGVRQYSVAHLSARDVRLGYLELAEIAQACRFGDCSHQVEPGCAVQQALADGAIADWRFANYQKLLLAE
ncbi:MAG: ribosome small subunit-dependent GTPase A [Granulosicoccus sp.]